ncbi:hypothetical protein KYC5002_26405 [Archangium violaceum]|uniref:ELWxxDGT repeat protein n=1 Tax=Archangium violaceum TaxID=83451 RepID=UPI00204FF6DD|nr:hypothetical protein [Archangium gephyra]WPB82628.1 hypothetical protein KYC5002_26405 [Archangium gephyra]
MRLSAGVLWLFPLSLALGTACGVPPASEEAPREEAREAAAYGRVDAAGLASGLGEPDRVEDSVPGRLSAGPFELTDAAGTLFFGATDAENGTELWRSDGTPGGTRIVEDIRPGPEGSALTALTAAGRRGSAVSGSRTAPARHRLRGSVRPTDSRPS